MTININDPRLTAFVLGELSEEEAQEIQTASENDAELQHEIEAIRQTVAQIKTAMQNEDGREPATVSPVSSPITPKKNFRWLIPTAVTALAASLLAAVYFGAFQPTVSPVARFVNVDRVDNRTSAVTDENLGQAVDSENTAKMDQKPAESALGRQDERLVELEDMPQLSRSLSEPSPNVGGSILLESELSSAMPTPSSENSETVGKKDVSESRRSSDAFAVEKQEQGQQEGESLDKALADTTSTGSVTGLYSKKSGGGMEGNASGTGGAIMAGDVSGTGSVMMGGMGGMGAGNVTVGGSLDNVERSLKQQVTMAQSAPVPERDASNQYTGSTTPGIVAKPDAKTIHLGFVPETSTPGIVVEPDFLKKQRDEIPKDAYADAKTEAYKSFKENDFTAVKPGEFSTFSIDVDTAAYSAMRRFINAGQKPPTDAVRLEEYINYFRYNYASPTDGKPFAVHTAVAQCPWESKHLLVRIGIKGKEYSVDERPPLNLVFLVDVSGSMTSSLRLPLVKRGLTELVEMLQPKDRVAIVTYAGSSNVVLPSVSGLEKQAILDSLESLNAGGSTAGAEGIKTAYETARKYYNENAQNRVILCTDGDFNVGVTDNGELEKIIGNEAKSGVFLTILGFGMGNYKDDRLKTLSMRGNGNYGYIDSLEECRKLLVVGLTGTLFAIAKDVKIQVDFNPANVTGYRLLGYENRKLRDEDFHNDKVDAGEIGAGHTVTALYEIVPSGIALPSPVDSSRYAVTKTEDGREPTTVSPTKTDELLFVKLRYKEPKEDKSQLLEYPVQVSKDGSLDKDASFAAAAALYGMLLRESRYSGNGDWSMVKALAEPAVGKDPYRQEFLQLLEKTPK